jgi:hypothetical protein
MFGWIGLRKSAAKDGHGGTTHTQGSTVCLAINTTRSTGNHCDTLGCHGCRKPGSLRTSVGSGATRTDNSHRIL